MSTNRIHTTTIDRPELLSRAAWFGVATLILTTLHHAYGAYAYGTLWRLHVGLLSIPAAAAIVIARLEYRRHPDDAIGAVAFWTVVVLTLSISVVLFGVFEGVYNHLLKNALYFGGASQAVMGHLFPPPTYELPSDVLFETSGVMQVVPASLAARSIYTLFRHPSTRSVVSAPQSSTAEGS